jgi:tripartite-type tricarboxylate transporter receptor subunit TctC
LGDNSGFANPASSAPRMPAFPPLRAAALAAACLCTPPVHAQAFPTKPIRWVVGFPAGGATDVTARILLPAASEKLGQQIVVDNRGGAHGNIASEIVAKAAPDGHTLLLGTISTLAINPGLYTKLPFDTARDFAPVTTLVSLSNVIAAHPSLGVSDLKGFIAAAKAKPGQITFATSGAGSPGHLAGELLKRMAGIDITHVPYKGGAPAINDTLAGQVNAMFATVPTAVPHIRAGKLRAIAVTTTKRSVALPDTPTVAEAGGFKGYEASNWYALLVPAKTPSPVVARLNAVFVESLQIPENRDRLLNQGLEPWPSTPEAFGTYLRAEIPKWSKIARESGAKVE